MSDGGSNAGLTGWRDVIKGLEPVAESLAQKWARPDATPAQRQEFDMLALSAVAGGYLTYVRNVPQQPVIQPLWNEGLNMGGPCPDYVYMTAEIDPAGTYRLAGFRGTSRFVDIVQTVWEMMGVSPMGGGLPTHDLDTLTMGPNGRFSVILSAERPAGYTGDWWQLQPKCTRLMFRQCSVDWLNEVDARFSIVRLDGMSAAPPTEISRRMANLPQWAEGIVTFGMRMAKGYREKHGVNHLDRVQYPGTDQYYFDAWFEMGADEALIIDSEIPKNYRYWSILVANDRFSTVDWIYRQSSLNDLQARPDSDGRIRFVVSARDPGVPNWLDNAANPCGIVQYRLNRADEIPVPQMTRVPRAEVRKHLPADTPAVSPLERKEILLRRAEAAQMRVLW
jgi:hypothetical protein